MIKYTDYLYIVKVCKTDESDVWTSHNYFVKNDLCRRISSCTKLKVKKTSCLKLHASCGSVDETGLVKQKKLQVSTEPVKKKQKKKHLIVAVENHLIRNTV